MPNITKTTQQFIPVKDVRDGVVVLKNGSLRLVLMVSSINFALKSEEEQVGILMQFQNFLNSLDFSVQITVQSRKLDIGPYLEMLRERHKKQTNELIKIQTKEYIEFINNFASSINIITKTFFIVIPYTTAAIDASRGFLDKFLKKKEEQHTAEERFEESKVQLEQRASIVEQGLAGSGVRTARLGTEELIELYYRIFNPGAKDKPPVPEQELE